MKKSILLGIGWLCVGLGFVGVFVPGIPTTIFLIIALWAFAKSSKKFHTWLINHKKFGPLLKNWQDHKVVPNKAKVSMVVLQILAVVIFYLFTKNIIFSILLALILVFVAWYVLSLPSTVKVVKNENQ
mgnify:CR=1 FL=1